MVTTTGITKTVNEHGRYANELDRYFKDMPYKLRPDKEWRVLFCGLTGDGKTLNAVGLLLTDWLFRGRMVYSNIQIEKTVQLNNSLKTYKAEPLDIESLYSMDDKLNDCAVFIDEANYWSDSRRSSSNQNIYIADVAQQTRKRRVSLIFTLMFAEWTDPRLRQLTDVCIRCRDQERTEWGRENNIGEGELFNIQVEDWSGKLTGQSYYMTGEPASEWTVRGKELWDSYNSYNLIDSHEARGSYKSVYNEKGLLIGKNENAERLKQLYGELEAYVGQLGDKGVRQIHADDLWGDLGINTSDIKAKKEIGHVLRAMGLTKNQRVNGYYYNIPEQTNPLNEGGNFSSQ